MNLSALALRRGAEEGMAGKPAFLTAQGPVSNEQFQRTVKSIAADLACMGLQPGDKILLRMTNSVEFAAGFLAVAWHGAIPVLHNSQFGQSELDHIVAFTKPKGVLSAAAKPDALAAAIRRQSEMAQPSLGYLFAQRMGDPRRFFLAHEKPQLSPHSAQCHYARQRHFY